MCQRECKNCNYDLGRGVLLATKRFPKLCKNCGVYNYKKHTISSVVLSLIIASLPFYFVLYAGKGQKYLLWGVSISAFLYISALFFESCNQNTICKTQDQHISGLRKSNFVGLVILLVLLLLVLFLG